jgi:hypothetical protein
MDSERVVNSREDRRRAHVHDCFDCPDTLTPGTAMATKRKPRDDPVLTGSEQADRCRTSHRLDVCLINAITPRVVAALLQRHGRDRQLARLRLRLALSAA